MTPPTQLNKEAISKWVNEGARWGNENPKTAELAKIIKQKSSKATKATPKPLIPPKQRDATYDEDAEMKGN